MASDLFNIGSSGLKAARAALEVTTQNIANAATEGYVRRSVSLSEMAAAGGYSRIGDLSLSGVRVAGIQRNADLFRQSELRRTGSDAARAGSELKGFENIESAIDQSNVYPAMTAFEGSLQRLVADPVDLSLRAAALEDARTLARTFNIAASALDNVGAGLRFEATDATAQVNSLSGELARVNLQLNRTAAGTSDQTLLLDQRDQLMQQLSGYADITTSIGVDQAVEVRIGGAPLVQGGTAKPFAMVTGGDGTISFTLDGAPVTVAGGSLAGKAQALIAVRDNKDQLDVIAGHLMTAANGAQGTGVALDGSAGIAMFTGSGAAGITLNLTSGSQIATAASTAGPGSRDPANLEAMRTALSSAGVAKDLDGMLFAVSSGVAGRKTTAQALDSIASAAKLAFEQQSGVDLDQEAANLVRFQQAFQANGKAIQIAADLFDTLLALK
ncbi:flagellar hook-associated protein FlgK [Novosphingobium sp. B 225]|uniref:flagellar hook-associated protein FlgK n=1 Tax=Novosphingobium sp. B 225 TaxID=1961849 RepID=UPI000B4B71F1|nr:flagellar hook-associated protein FlgK [Novosphingobium sp. B 225]